MVRITSLALLASAVMAAPATYLRQQIAAQTEAIEIAGGNEVQIGKHPYVTGLRDEEAGPNFCGGSLISPTTVLTSAQCAYNPVQYVSVGSHFRSGTSDGERIKVKSTVLHPKFDPESSVYNFAILELETPSKVTPIEISFEDDVSAPGVTSILRGWDTDAPVSGTPTVLKEVGLKIWSNKDCQAAFGALNNPSLSPVDATMLCAGGVLGEGTCDGDFGAPLTVSKDGKDVLVAVMSWSLDCAKTNLPVVHSRLSYAKDFITPYLPKPAC